MQANAIQSNSDLPPELCAKPLALIGISGLDVINNAVHKSIWDIFSNSRRNEHSPVRFNLIENDHEFPIIKPKRNSYDWYIPKGILKKNWMHKHLHEIPAVMVIFYDLDWNDLQWNEKMIECASRVQSMRAALEGRASRIVIVLIQTTLPLPAGEDALAAERAVALCSSCELNSQSLFVLPHGDHLQGYATRLENAFYEFAQTYYHNEAKIIKSHKEHLNKNTHQYLYVRHQFKLGFLNELKQDIHTAYKHYNHAYENLLEIRIVDTNSLEIRTIAGFLNYKLCRLLFALNLPRDAISQFKSHIDRFRGRIGFQELAFEHYAWLSKQYSVFGDIFDEAVKLGLPAVQTQHPGIYYQQAALQAILRKKACKELCSTVIAYPSPDPLEGANNIEFYGQRPWRPGKMTSEPPDPHLEAMGIQAIQYLEKLVNHSNIIIQLYGLAISQYKTYKCPRTRRQLVLEMADECYDSKDYGKALTLYTHMLWDFRKEKWWGILSQVLEKALICAFLTANVQDYIQLALELLGANTTTSLDDKRRIYENLKKILKKQIPYGDPKLPQDILQNAIIIWQPVFSSNPLHFSLDMANIAACIETRAKFLKNVYEVDQNVTVEIYIRSTCPFPLVFAKISVTINAPNCNSEFAVTNVENIALSFRKDEVKKFVIEFMPDPHDINKEIQIGSINIQLGNSTECSVDLKYSSYDEAFKNHPELVHFRCAPNGIDFDNIRPLSSSTIVPRESKLSISFDHRSPALVGEWYQIVINIVNEEMFGIKDLKIEVVLDEENFESELSLQPSSPCKQPLIVNSPKNLDCNGKNSTHFFVRVHKPCKCNVTVRVTYTLDSQKAVLSIKTEVIPLPVVEPFTVTTKYLSMLMSEIDRFYVDEEFGVMNYIKFSSPWMIHIEDTSLEFVHPGRSAEKSSSSQIAGRSFNNEEISAELHIATCQKSSDQGLNLGKCKISWKRENGITTTTEVAIQGLPCYFMPIGLKLAAPAHGFVRTPMLLKYHLENRSRHLIQLDVVMQATEAFMFSGYKQFVVSILPNSTRTLQYNLYPLIAGSVALPELVISPESNTDNEVQGINKDQLNALIHRSLPTHIYVMPQVKGTPKLPEIVANQKIQIVD
ncbi:unnamed protein product [Callosobruchus maculatus]|uniref:Trafficking protein particle complex subunit 11 n=2 Tax=Callosobruchus maculatus TaxID=64391 RepID=A0A653D107_CALMS|nr:unnamed protein product [Callosobruchus maculatus]